MFTTFIVSIFMEDLYMFSSVNVASVSIGVVGFFAYVINIKFLWRTFEIRMNPAIVYFDGSEASLLWVSCNSIRSTICMLENLAK